MTPPLRLVLVALQRPRYLFLLGALAVLTVTVHWSSKAETLQPVRIKGASTGSSWETLAAWGDDLDFENEDSSRWKQSVGDWLNWNKDVRKTLLVTGGAGQLGQALIPTLTDEYIVHVIDIAPRPASLPKAVIYHRDSILPSPRNALSSLFATTSFHGVIHLAGVSLESWCKPKETQCHEVNVQGTEAVLREIETTITRSKRSRMWLETRVPWVLLASSVDVIGYDDTTEDAERRPQTSIGRTKAAAEEALETVLQRYANSESRSPIHSMILRFSEIYGYAQAKAIPDAFINSLISNSLTGLPIQYSDDTVPLDLLHVDDAVAGVVAAIDRLDKASSEEMPGGVDIVNMVQGQRWKAEDIVQIVRMESQSLSPVRNIGDHKGPELPNLSRAMARELLDWEPVHAATIGLGLALEAASEEIADYSRQYLHQHCAPSPDFPGPEGSGTATFIEDERNRDLTKLDGCTINMAFDYEGWLHHVKCEDGKHCTADGEHVTAMNWNQSVFIVHKIAGGNKQSERRVRVVFEEEKGMGYLGYRQAGGEEVGLELFDRHTTEGHVEFEVEVSPHSSYLRLLIPDSGTQIHALSNTTSETTWFTMEPTTRWVNPHFDLRMNVLCCPSEGDWPLLLDDYESADMRFGTSGQIAFNSSRRTHLCERAERSVRYNFQRLSTARQAVNKVENGQEAHVWKSDKGTRTKHTPHDWALKELPACWNDCDSPSICVQTGDCKCVQADQCHRKRENPILSLWPIVQEAQASSGKSHLGALAGYSHTLTNAVAKVDWKDVLLPSARAAITAHPDFIKVHVADGYKEQQEIESAECMKLQTKHCFSADAIMYKALRHIQVSADEADLIVIPVYQQCFKFLLHDAIHHATQTIPAVKSGEKPMSLVLTHDWGICISFAWELWAARDHHTLYPDWILNNVLVWSVMGDYDSPCYRPHQDVVIPARTCQSVNLRETFPDAEHIKPMRERPHLIAWSGTYWGTGKSDRLRLTCSRGGAGERELYPGAGPQSYFLSWDYMNDLNDARFCPQPRGIAGWSPRTNDAIFAGCIPVLIAEGSHYPFASFLDWSKFSVRVAPTELDRIEEILASIPLAKVEEMQANLVAVREAFMYSTDEHPEDELNRRGPMFFALHEASQRLRTRYPVKQED
ncbi:hypothetical protein IAU60_006470 [Kwoniella sp. DSM 27419]